MCVCVNYCDRRVAAGVLRARACSAAGEKEVVIPTQLLGPENVHP